MNPTRFMLVALALSVAGCVSSPPHTMLTKPAPVFSPQAFFDGETIGDGTLKTDFSGAKRVHVVGHGHLEQDGTLVLEQRVEEGRKAARTRTWNIRPAGGGKFTGTLSDAEGPVSAFVRGNLLHIRFKAKGNLEIEQWMYLQAGGNVVLNRMAVRKFGITIAALIETISRQN